MYFEEGMSFVDSFYFIMMTVTTIGYGDITPTKNVTKWFVSFYSIVGVTMFFVAASFMASISFF
jgi:voltage-gated potassium channel